jgi:hypothetical protein
MGTVGGQIAFQPEAYLMSHSLEALELFQPQPDVFYSLDATAHLAGVPR